MALGSAGRFACVYIPSTFLYFIDPPGVHTARATARERKSGERGRGSGAGGHTHTSQTRPHTGAHILRDGDTPVRIRRGNTVSPVSPSSKILCLLLRRYCVFEDTVYSKILCSKRQPGGSTSAISQAARALEPLDGAGCDRRGGR